MQRIDRRRAIAALAGLACWPATHAWAAWREGSPESQGMDAQVLQQLVAHGRAEQMDSLLVARNGVIVCEAYYEPFRAEMRHAINSATKGVVAALVGMAIGQGRLAGTEAAVLDFFPGREFAHDGAFKRTMTVQHLLDMTSGLDWAERLGNLPPTSLREMRASGDWVRFVLDRPMALPPGQAFNYNSGNSHLLSAILTRVTGEPTEAFAREHLLGPLGIEDVEWDKDPQGISTGGFGLRMTTRDMAKIAQLYLHRGAWAGRQLVPQEWVARVHESRVPMLISAGLDFRYADQWWRLPEFGAVMAVGFNRQVMLVMPDKQLVAAMTGRAHWDFRQVLGRLRAATP
jgi:CubicO group peptidase (beta-lactamase class C family)